MLNHKFVNDRFLVLPCH